MNNTNELYNRWLAQPDLDDAVKAELVSIAGDSDAVTDRFYRDLEFGTGGLRGVIGAGINRMNIYVVRRATQGLANYIIKQGGADKGVAHCIRLPPYVAGICHGGSHDPGSQRHQGI